MKFLTEIFKNPLNLVWMASLFVLISFWMDSSDRVIRANVVNLSSEYVTSLNGVADVELQLGWMLKSRENDEAQTAYRILVASSTEELLEDTGDLWDTGKVESGQFEAVIYKGKPLELQVKYFWKVMIWDKNRNASKWSIIGKLPNRLVK